jgi:hypothetical protein
MFLVCVAIMVSLTTGNSFLLSIWLFPDRPCSAKVYVFFCKKNSTFAKRNTDNPPLSPSLFPPLSLYSSLQCVQNYHIGAP